MDIKTIGVWRFAVEDAINLLARLGGKGYELPTIGEVEALSGRLERTSPFEVVASILADNDYKSHKQRYLAAFGGVLNCEAFIGCVKADGKIIDYWGGLADKLKAAAPEIDKNMYLSAVERLSNMVQENIAGMKKDLDGIFAKQTAQEPQQIATKQTRGRGRPKETFKDKMIDDADGKKLEKIHTIMRGKKGKDFSLLILACIKKGWITRPTYTQAADEFGEIGSKTGFNRYLDERMFGEKEIMGAINSLD